MNKEDIDRINLRKLAVPNKKYTDNEGNVYIGTDSKRLKILDKASITTFKPSDKFDPNTKDVQKALEEVNSEITIIKNDYVTEVELSTAIEAAIEAARCFSVVMSIIL